VERRNRETNRDEQGLGGRASRTDAGFYVNCREFVGCDNLCCALAQVTAAIADRICQRNGNIVIGSFAQRSA
jgi:hypothetical protein